MSATLKTRLVLNALESREVPAAFAPKPEPPADAAILVGMLHPQPISTPQSMKPEAHAVAAILVGMLHPQLQSTADRTAILVGMLDQNPEAGLPAVQIGSASDVKTGSVVVAPFAEPANLSAMWGDPVGPSFVNATDGFTSDASAHFTVVSDTLPGIQVG